MSYFDSLLRMANGKPAIDPNLPSLKPGLVDPTMAEVMRDDMVGKDWRYTPQYEDRIHEIDAQIAELKKQLSSLDTESEMGKYKFVWDGDPSTYTTVKQNKRNAEETAKLRKASEDATKASQVKTAWKQNVIDTETEKYNLSAAQNRADNALRTGNREEYVRAMTDVKRSEAALKRFQRDNDEMRKKFSSMLGLGENAEPVKEEAYDQTADGNIAKIDAYNSLVENLNNGITDIRTRVGSMDKNAKAKYIANAKQQLAQYKQAAAEVGKYLDPQTRTELNNKIVEFEDAIPKFKKNQTTEMTQAEFEKKTYAQLVAMGLKALRGYQAKGFTNPKLEQALANAK